MLTNPTDLYICDTLFAVAWITNCCRVTEGNIGLTASSCSRHTYYMETVYENFDSESQSQRKERHSIGYDSMLNFETSEEEKLRQRLLWHKANNS
jgi:hypothetical protein